MPVILGARKHNEGLGEPEERRLYPTGFWDQNPLPKVSQALSFLPPLCPWDGRLSSKEDNSEPLRAASCSCRSLGISTVAMWEGRSRKAVWNDLSCKPGRLSVISAAIRWDRAES